jgi:hypothetical protein
LLRPDFSLKEKKDDIVGEALDDRGSNGVEIGKIDG